MGKEGGEEGSMGDVLEDLNTKAVKSPWRILTCSHDLCRSPLAYELYPMVALSSYVIHLFIFPAQAQ